MTAKKSLKNGVLTVLMIICALVFAVSAYFLYQELAVYKKGSSEYSSWVDAAVISEDPENPLGRVIDFNALKAANPDVVGWIYIPGTVVDYPVVQTTDNDKYLTTLFSGEKNKAGTIFMDYRNKADFSSDNTILYGHNMKNKSMFHVLVEYANQDFYDQHKSIYYYTEDGAYEMRIFSTFRVPATDIYTATSFGSKKEEYLNTFVSRSAVSAEEKPSPDSKILTLSTCTYEFDDARFVVQATVNKMPYAGAGL